MSTFKEDLGHLIVWWFPRNFSQSRFGAYQSFGTNSCTLISLIMSSKIAKEVNGFHESSDDLPPRAIELYATAINQGNMVYSHTFSKNGAHNVNINIPDALSALRDQPFFEFRLHEWFYTHLRGDPNSDSYERSMSHRLAHVLRVGVGVFREPFNRNRRPKYIFAALIGDSRTVVFSFEFKTEMITFFDSHQHGRGWGAVIAQSTFGNLSHLVDWYISMIYTIYASKPKLFEVSFLTQDLLLLPRPRMSDEHIETN